MLDEDKSKEELIAELRILRAKLAVQNQLAHMEDEKLRPILNAMHDSVVMLDTEGRVILLNRHLAESMHMTVEDAIGQTIYELLPPEIAASRMSQYLTALSKRELIQFEDERRGRRFHHAVFPIFDIEGNNNCMLIFVQEITFHWQIRRAQAQAQKYLDTNAAILVSLNREGKIVLINQAGCELLGYEKDELIGKDWFDTCIPIRLREQMKLIFQQLMSNEMESLDYYENPVLSKSGEERLIGWQNSILTEDNNGEIDGTLSSGIDITERKRMEYALQENEAKTRAILEALPDLMFRLSRDGTHLEFYAPQLSQLFAEPDDFLGKTVHEVLPPETAQLYITAIEATLEQRQVQVFEYSLNFEEQDTRHYEARMVVAGVDEVLVIVRDITRRKQTEAQQLELHVQHERIELLENVISDLSHDIKTPLTNMKTSLYLLKRLQEPEKRQQQMNKLDTQIERLAKLVDNILIMSRLDKGAELIFAPTNLNWLLDIIQEEYFETAEAKGIKLSIETKQNLPIISGHEIELSRCISLIVENAISYTSKSGSISIRSYLTDSQIVIEVQDTGIGISETDLPCIFQRFYKADKSRNSSQGGTGLGLAIAKRIIELHGGQIGVESTLGEGSIFRIQLPLQD